MLDTPTESQNNLGTFLTSRREHVLMITNHGVHQWKVVPGLPDTGGQNVFVNHFTATLAQVGFKITIVNRGGYAHPVTGERLAGFVYRDAQRRILYLEDNKDEFVRKEDMHEQIPRLVESLARSLDIPVDLIISHYWDGAQIGVLYNRTLPEPVKHIWVPHSLGAVKKRNVSPRRWAGLRIDERIAVEQDLIAELDGVASTSSKISQALDQGYGYRGKALFLPPCVDPERYHARAIQAEDGVWDFLSQHSGLSPDQVRRAKIVTEISRTDTTKRKDVLIRAFALARQRVPDSLLVVSIDKSKKELFEELNALIQALDLQDHVAVVGSVWDMLPTLYAITDVYCTPSVMEGFGMSAQEATASGVPVVASHLVPFVTEYLLGKDVEAIDFAPDRPPVRQGQGALVIQADDVQGFAHALETLLGDDALRREMGENAYRATIPYFTWHNRVAAFLAEINTP
jgi:mannosylfructose-phosphate synthase